jgi:hypothetical protein
VDSQSSRSFFRRLKGEFELKTMILDLLKAHPTKAKHQVVFDALVDFASVLVDAQHGNKARDFWLENYDLRHPVKKVEPTTGAGK